MYQRHQDFEHEIDQACEVDINQAKCFVETRIRLRAVQQTTPPINSNPASAYHPPTLQYTLGITVVVCLVFAVYSEVLLQLILSAFERSVLPPTLVQPLYGSLAIVVALALLEYLVRAVKLIDGLKFLWHNMVEKRLQFQ